MKLHTITILLAGLILSNCSAKISKHFDTTHYVQDFNTHIVNDSLQLYLKTPADIRFEKDKELIINRLENEKLSLSGVLAYGATNVPPHYRFFLLLNPKKSIQAKNKYEFVRDTVINSNNLVVFCRSKEIRNTHSFKNDCQEVFEGISTDNNYRESIASIFDLSRRFGNKYLKALDQIQAYPTKDRNEEFLQLQMAINFASFLAPSTTYDSLLARFPTSPARDSIKTLIKERATQGKQNVFEQILQSASDKKLVMLNENHFYPNHRVSLKLLLPQFKKRGFTHLALEALGENQDSLLNAGYPPTIDSGFYTKEPRFADLIRTAQELGFTLVSYENTDPEKEREKAQAENLVRKTFSKSDSARVIVLAGLDHILEKPTENGKKWLAHILRTKYNLDPLTISQSHLNNYQELGNPLTLLSADALDDYTLNSVDYLLLNNLSLKDDNPNFSFRNKTGETVQFSVFLASESTGAYKYFDKIPYRTTLLKPSQEVSYRLPEKKFIRVIYSREGKILEEKEVKP